MYVINCKMKLKTRSTDLRSFNFFSSIQIRSFFSLTHSLKTFPLAIYFILFFFREDFIILMWKRSCMKIIEEPYSWEWVRKVWWNMWAMLLGRAYWGNRQDRGSICFLIRASWLCSDIDTFFFWKLFRNYKFLSMI